MLVEKGVKNNIAHNRILNKFIGSVYMQPVRRIFI